MGSVGRWQREGGESGGEDRWSMSGKNEDEKRGYSLFHREHTFQSFQRL